MPNVSARLIEFALLLRANNYPASSSNIQDAHRVAEVLSLHKLHNIRTGFRACFCSTADQWKRFDKLFYTFWFYGTQETETESPDDGRKQQARTAPQQRMVGLAGTSSDKEHSVNVYGSGDYNALSLADFRFVFNPREKALIDQYVDELGQRARRQFNRKKRITASGSRVAMRQSLRQTLRYQGAAFDLKFESKQKKLPNFVLLLDISQSMDVYARLFLRFARKLLSVFETSHAFAFNIALIDLGTGHYALQEAEFEKAINAAAEGWVGGTRIAASLRTFNERYSGSVVNAKTTVLVFSDGCDTAPPEELNIELEKVSRRARRIVWVNPLIGRFPEGHVDDRMAVVMPHITNYVSAHNLPSLIKLQKVLLS